MKGLLKNSDEATLQANLLSTVISSVSRTGKWILFTVTDPLRPPTNVAPNSLLSHLGMFGTWQISSDKLAPSLPHTRLRLTVAGRQGPRFLAYTDTRNFGRIYCFTQSEALQYLRDRVGVDATVVTPSQLQYSLRRDVRPVVEILLDQSKISGVGNIYRSEILYQARLSPYRPGTDLVENEIMDLWKATRSVISKAIELRGTSIRDYRDTNGNKGEFGNFLKVYGREGMMCPYYVVGSHTTLIQSTKEIDGRTVYYCPSCQR
jgi:formamidopyrimidine-DNA glycosylase